MKKLRSMGRGRRLALAGVSIALALGVIAPSAFASVEFPAGPYGAEDTVTVHGVANEGVEGATGVAIVLCNEEPLMELGGHCDRASASGGPSELIEPIANYESGITINIRKGPWQDWSYLMGVPPVEVEESETTCKGGTGSQCAIVVSFYKGTVSLPEQVGIQWKSIDFG